MAGKPQRRERERLLREEALREGASRATLSPQMRQLAQKLREERQNAETTIEGKRPKNEIREETLDDLFPRAKDVIDRALDGGEVNKEQLQAAFRVFEQQLGRPRQEGAGADKDQPIAIIYEAAFFDPTVHRRKLAAEFGIDVDGLPGGDVDGDLA